MKGKVCAALLLVLGCSLVVIPKADAQSVHANAVVGKQPDGSYLVPTGQIIRPAGKNVTFDNRPVDMALSPDGRILAVMTPGGVRFLDTRSEKFRRETLTGDHGFGGIVWSRDGRTLYASGRSNKTGVVFVTTLDRVLHTRKRKPISFTLNPRIRPNGKATDADPAGLALSPDGHTLYVSLFNNATIAAVDLNRYDPDTGVAPYAETTVGSSPEAICVSPDGNAVYVANRGGRIPEPGDTMDTTDPVVVDPVSYKVASGSVAIVSAAEAKRGGEAAVSIPVGLEPAALALSPDGARLFVANANSDSISVIDTAAKAVVETIQTSPAPARLSESSPNALVVTRDGRNLFVSLGGDNAVEQISLDAAAGGKAHLSRITGLIPTAWFPLSVQLSPDQRTLYIANSKGIGSLGAEVKELTRRGAAIPEAGPGGGVTRPGVRRGHSVYAVLGSVSVVPVPDDRTLTTYTAAVATNDHFDRMAATLQQAPDVFWSRFKHVILVIKENRSYDQVLGDMPTPPGTPGGDPGLLMFGENVTPNTHALAREFGLLDNLYCSGEISADGHHWLDEAFADDYDERAMNDYPRSYPCCGTDPLSFAGNKFIWQAAIDAGRTFRDYGEYGPQPGMLRHESLDWYLQAPVTASRGEDTAHAESFAADIAGPLGLPQFCMVWLPNDHTSGTRPGAYTPEADVADNDLGLGKLVDAVSHNKRYWQDEPTAIFVVEDDAQGGLDHVDGHRTVGLVISPYTRRRQIVSENLSQLNMVRTIELMLGLPPLNQFDAAALPMRDLFQDKGDFRAFNFEPNRIALNLKNPSLHALSGLQRRWARISADLDFSKPDRADPELLTEALWHHTHGEAAYPPPHVAAF